MRASLDSKNIARDIALLTQFHHAVSDGVAS